MLCMAMVDAVKVRITTNALSVTSLVWSSIVPNPVPPFANGVKSLSERPKTDPSRMEVEYRVMARLALPSGFFDFRVDKDPLGVNAQR